jgi:hypothetical protein
MVDKSRLQIIGWLFGSATAAVMLIAALLVSEAVASHQWRASAAAIQGETH